MKFLKLLLIGLLLAVFSAGCSFINQPNTAEQPQSSEQAQNQAGVDNPSDDSLDNPQISPTNDGEGTSYTVTLYFTDNKLLNIYRFEKEIKVKDKADLPKAALETWIAGPEEEGLVSLVPPDVEVEFVKDRDGVAHVSLSREIKNANVGSTGDLFIMEQITMIMQQFGFNKTQVLVEGKVEESILGHMYTGEPFTAKDPESYQKR